MQYICRIKTIVAILSIAALLAGCSSAEPVLSPLAPDAVVLAFGDSLTYGTGAGTEQSYPEVLARLSGREVLNFGVPGEVSQAGLQRLPELLDEYQPDLLLLCHGGNDLLRKLSVTQLQQNLVAMIRAAQTRNIPVVLIAVPRPSVLYLNSAEIYQAVADETQVPLETGVLAEILSDHTLKSDQVHPNAAGYRQLAHAVYELLQSLGAL
jgi:acyl-CoA thioesterase-1